MFGPRSHSLMTEVNYELTIESRLLVKWGMTKLKENQTDKGMIGQDSLVTLEIENVRRLNRRDNRNKEIQRENNSLCC